jgi:hypothetical protein
MSVRVIARYRLPRMSVLGQSILSLAGVLNPSALQPREELLHRRQLGPYHGD